MQVKKNHECVSYCGIMIQCHAFGTKEFNPVMCWVMYYVLECPLIPMLDGGLDQNKKKRIRERIQKYLLNFQKVKYPNFI